MDEVDEDDTESEDDEIYDEALSAAIEFVGGASPSIVEANCQSLLEEGAPTQAILKTAETATSPPPFKDPKSVSKKQSSTVAQDIKHRGYFSGKSFAFTGVMTGLNQDAAERLVNSYGGKVLKILLKL